MYLPLDRPETCQAVLLCGIVLSQEVGAIGWYPGILGTRNNDQQLSLIAQTILIYACEYWRRLFPGGPK